MVEQSASNAASANGMVRCMTDSKLPHPWIARRTATFDGSGIRRIFDLAATMKDPVDLSIGQPHFEVPKAIQKAAVEAITTGKNGYSATAGIAPLRGKTSVPHRSTIRAYRPAGVGYQWHKWRHRFGNDGTRESRRRNHCF